MVPPGAIQPGGAGPVWTPMEAYAFAWKLVTKKFGAVAVPLVVGALVMVTLMGVVYAAVILGPQILVEQGLIDGSLALVLTYASMSVLILVVLVIQSYMLGGFHTVALKAVRGQPTSVGDVFSGGKYMLTYFIGLLVQQILTAIGYALCIVPGVMLICGIWAWGYLVIDQGMGGVDALKRSWEMMKGHKMNVFIWGLLSILVYVAGELACVLPVLLISMPMIIISSAWIYLRIKGESIPEPT